MIGKVRLVLLFPGDEEEIDVSHLVIDRSVTIDPQFCSDEFYSAVDVMRFSLKHDLMIVSKLHASHARIAIRATDYLTDSPLFYGAIEPTSSQSAGQTVGNIDLEAVDNTWRLDEPLSVSFSFPALIGDSGWFLYNSNSPSRSIFHFIVTAAGYLPQEISEAVFEEIIPYAAATKNEQTSREFLDTLLFESGYVLHASRSGFLYIAPWVHDGQTYDELVGPADLSTVSPVSWAKSAEYRDGAKVVWSSPSVIENALVFRDSLPVSSDGTFEGKAIAAGDYYPADSDIEETYQNFVETWLDVPYQSRETRLKNKDLSLITTSDHEILFSADDGVVVDFQEFEGQRARVRFQNTSAATAKIYWFEIRARALIRLSLKNVTAPEGSTNPREYTSQFILEETPAIKLTQAIAIAVAFADFKYTFASNRSFAVGMVIRLVEERMGIDTAALIQNATESQGNAQVQYTAIALADPSGLTYAEWSKKVTSGWLEAQNNLARLALRLTYDEHQNGYDDIISGGTTIPSIPEIQLQGGFRSVTVVADVQANLTNFAGVDIQVTDAAGLAAGTWYAPRWDGYDWRAVASDGYLTWPSHMFVHTRIPLAGTVEAPLPLTLYYRVRRRTKAPLLSEWCAPHIASASNIDTGEIAEHSITADKLTVAILNTLNAVISGDLIIDSDAGFLAGQAADAEGNERAYLNELAVAFERFSGGLWRTMARLSRDGLQAPQVYADGSLVISNGTNATRRARGFDLGIPYPSSEAKVFHFDGDANDQSGASQWTFSGAKGFDRENIAILSQAPFTIGGGSLFTAGSFEKEMGNELFGAWWVDFFVCFPLSLDNFETLYIGNAANGLTITFLESFIEYIDPEETGELEYVATGASGELEYVGTKADTNITIAVRRNGINETVRVLVNRGEWLHIAAGYRASTDILSIVLDSTVRTFEAFNQGGSDAMLIRFNGGLVPGCAWDEVMYDLTTAIDMAKVVANTSRRIPWAANDYQDNTFVLEASDPSNVKTNLVQSGYVSGKGWWTKLPDGTLIQRGTTPLSSRWSPGAYPFLINGLAAMPTFPIDFIDTDYQIFPTGLLTDAGDDSVIGNGYARTVSTSTLVVYKHTSSLGNSLKWIAIGRWK